jgi:hypothetical protein
MPLATTKSALSEKPGVKSVLAGKWRTSFTLPQALE